ncbi:CoA-binding protein [Bacillus fonticola]|uniref:CoA-binding protein n=1 Tax=Bacillus fonticola TaxID=2728853 RepID=UPI00147575E9|nr:CoA-binding protein [Bacillus fonticola]
MSVEHPSRDTLKKWLEEAKTIAVVGLSNNPNRTSYQIAVAMEQAGYTIVPVNPNISDWQGKKAFASLDEVDIDIDIVNVFRRSVFVKDLLEPFLRIGAKTFWTQLGVQDEYVYKQLTEKGVQVVMDRCIKVEQAITGATPK